MANSKMFVMPIGQLIEIKLEKLANSATRVWVICLGRKFDVDQRTLDRQISQIFKYRYNLYTKKKMPKVSHERSTA